MKRLLFILAAAAALAAAAVFLLPERRICQERIMALVKEQAEEAGVKSLEFGKVNLLWLPYPRLSAPDLRVEGDGFSLEADLVEISIYVPALLEFRFDPLPLKVELDRPVLHLSRIPEKYEDERLSPPARVLSVRHGSLTMSSQVTRGLLPVLKKRLRLKGVNGMVEMEPQEMEWDLEMETSVADRIRAEGSYSFEDRTFEIDAEAEGLDFSSFKAGGRSTPAGVIKTGLLNLSLTASGRLGGEMSGNLTAYSPCLTVKPEGEQVPFSCGSLKADFGLKEGMFALYLRQLEFQSPKISLEGRVMVELGPEEEGGGEVLVDIKGRDIDLLQVRKAVRGLLSWDSTAMEVTDIVLGGHADSLGVRFSGTVSRMGDVDPWTITAQVRDVPVYVPDADLKLDSVSGSLLIEQGLLFVDAEDLRLRQAHSKRARAEIGISEENYRIYVDADLEAPLKDVYWSLSKFVDSSEFQTHLSEVQVNGGLARGRLEIRRPDTGGDIDVSVEATPVKGQIIYKPLGWQLNLDGGKIAYQKERLKWDGVKGWTAGSSLSWFSGQAAFGSRAFFQVTGARGRVSLKELHELLSYAGVDLSAEPLRLSRLDGVARLNSLKLFLPVNYKAPFKWRASFSPDPLVLKVADEFLAWPLEARGGTISISPTALGLKQVRCLVRDSSVKVSGKVLVRGPGLDLDLSGRLTRPIVLLLAEQGLIPKRLIPRTPCLIKGLKVAWNLKGDGAASAGGQISWPSEDTSVWFQYRGKGQMMDVSRIEILSGKERAFASFRYSPAEAQWLSASFRGRLSSATLDAVMSTNWLLKGDLSGDAAMALTNSGAAGSGGSLLVLNGRLEGRNFFLPITESRLMRFDRLSFNGSGGSGDISLAASYRQDQFFVDADFKTAAGSLGIYGDLFVAHLSNETVRELKQYLASAAEGLVTDGQGKRGQKGPGRAAAGLNLDVKGSLSFSVDSLDIDLKTVVPSMPSHDMRIENISGSADFLSNEQWSVDAESDSMCGTLLEVGLKRTSPENLIKHVRMRTPKDSRVEFTRFFKCLGIPMKRVAGPFSFDLMLDGRNQEWTDGYLNLEAEEGIIAKGGLLSRILGVLNLTDLFSMSRNNVFGAPGFPYHELMLKAFMARPDEMEIEEAVVKGRGLNLYATGSMNLKDLTLDMMVFVSPLKSVDTIISHVPIIGAIIGGKHRTLFVIPVKVSGDVTDPRIDVQQARAVTGIFEKLIINVIKAPLSIFVPEKDGNKGEVERRMERAKEREQEKSGSSNR